jgi:hypothetical protein
MKKAGSKARDVSEIRGGPKQATKERPGLALMKHGDRICGRQVGREQRSAWVGSTRLAITKRRPADNAWGGKEILRVPGCIAHGPTWHSGESFITVRLLRETGI